MTTQVIENVTGSDVGLPICNGTAGSRLAVLRHCLVTVGGWSEVYTSGNVAWFRAPTGNRMYLRVDDSAAQEARLVGYVTHNAGTDTGGGPFPTGAQVSGGLWLRGSNVASTLARPWACHVWGAGFRLLVWHTGYPGDLYSCGSLLFTDIVDLRVPGDAYGTLIKGNTSSYSNSTPAPLARATGNYIAGPYTQSAVSTAVELSINPQDSSSSWLRSDNAGASYPDPLNETPVVSLLYVLENRSVRGRVPGHYSHNYSGILPATLPADTIPGRDLRSYRGYWGAISTSMIVEASDWGGAL